jgi:uncharacterized hydrophobic protein (TIGR00271 family)
MAETTTSSEERDAEEMPDAAEEAKSVPVDRAKNGLRISMEERSALRSSLFGHGDQQGHTLRFWMLLTLSLVIATMGLTTNASAVVIGAMLIAPLMAPILATAAGIAMGSAKLSFRWARTVVFASVFGFLLSAGLSLLVPGNSLTDEVLSRTAPDLRDLVVAIAAGIAGAYATAKTDTSAALPGVAVAVALVPPLGAIGVAFEANRMDLAEGAALLYATNLLAITASGVAVFLILGLGPRNLNAFRRMWTRFGAASAAVVVIALAVLLFGQSRVIADRNNRQTTAEAEVQTWLADSPNLEIDEVRIDGRVITVDLTGSDEPPRLDPLVASLNDELGDVEVKVRWSQRTQRSSTEKADPADLTLSAVRTVAEEWISSTPRNTLSAVRLENDTAVVEVIGPDTPPQSARLVDLLDAAGVPVAVEVLYTQQRELSDDELRLQAREIEIRQITAEWAADIDPDLDVVSVEVNASRAEIILAGPLVSADPDDLQALLRREVDPNLTVDAQLTVRVPLAVQSE